MVSGRTFSRENKVHMLTLDTWSTAAMAEARPSQAQLMRDAEANYDEANPPERPYKRRRITEDDNRFRDSFLVDFENECLRDYGDEWPKGKDRWKDPEWAKHIKSQVYPFHSDVDWHEYVAWVSAGGGDEWFVEE